MSILIYNYHGVFTEPVFTGRWMIPEDNILILEVVDLNYNVIWVPETAFSDINTCAGKAINTCTGRE